MDIYVVFPFVAVSLLTLMIYTVYTIRYRHGDRVSSTFSAPASSWPKVSILKPLRRSDDDIEANLRSFFFLDYPDYEILFGVDSKDDPVVRLIERLMEEFPEIPVKIVVTGHTTRQNPKIYKLAMMEKACNGSLYWVNDSNIRTTMDTLKRLVTEYLEGDVKLIFCPIRATGSQSVGSVLENAYINHFVSGNIIAAWKLVREPIIVGKSILIEREALNRFGGFSYLKNYLAEDYMLGITFNRNRVPISTNCVWVTNVNRTTTITGFMARMERWAKLRFHLRRHFYFLEFLLNPVPLAFAAPLLWGSDGWILLGACTAMKIGMEALNFLWVNEGDRSRFMLVLTLPLWVLLKDWLLFWVYFKPFISRTVRWRGGTIRIGKNTRIAATPETLMLDSV